MSLFLNKLVIKKYKNTVAVTFNSYTGGILNDFSIVVPAKTPQPPNILYGPQSLIDPTPFYIDQANSYLNLIPSGVLNEELVKDESKTIKLYP